ncbi:MAG TPA: hypothetical protein VEY95_09885 [Azospirillaceae bacterium]|nr:hypothetical protein [Azospirillaceae bacterium]
MTRPSRGGSATARAAGALVMAGTLALAGCGQTAALLAGESWPPRAPVVPPAATVAIATGVGWDGPTAATGTPQIVVARNQAEWLGLWNLADQAPPVPLPAGASAIGVFLGNRGTAARVVTTDVIVTPPRTLQDQPSAVVNYITFRSAGVPATATGGGASLSPWAIRIVPVGQGPIQVVEQPVSREVPIEPPPATAVALANGTAFEGRAPRPEWAEFVVARNEAEWRDLWALAGLVPPRPLPANMAALGLFMGSSAAGGRVFTADVVREPSGSASGAPMRTVVRYAVNYPDAAQPAGPDAAGAHPFAVRLLEGAASEVAVVDLRGEAQLPARWDLPISQMIGGGPAAPRIPVSSPPKP